MSLIKWEPFGGLDRFFEDLPSELFSRAGFDLAVDVYEEKGNIVARMNLPGVDPEKVEVNVENGYLRISGSREEEKEEKGKHYYSREIRKGSFERAVRLPGDVDEGKAGAEYENGVLTTTLPKRESEKHGGGVKISVKK